MHWRWIVFSSALVAVGCGPPTPLERGTALFSSPAFSPASTNVFACATCHRVAKAADPSRRLPGYSLYDVVVRGTWWGGSVARLLDAVNQCNVAFMRGSRFGTDDESGRALLVYLQSITPDAKADPLPLTTVSTLNAAYYARLGGGDPGRGATTYSSACAFCHGDLHTGKNRLGPNVSVIPEESVAAHGLDPLTGARAITVEKVRHGRFFGVGGNMPEYSLEALSDSDLADLLAYVASTTPGF